MVLLEDIERSKTFDFCNVLGEQVPFIDGQELEYVLAIIVVVHPQDYLEYPLDYRGLSKSEPILLDVEYLLENVQVSGFDRGESERRVLGLEGLLVGLGPAFSLGLLRLALRLRQVLEKLSL